MPATLSSHLFQVIEELKKKFPQHEPTVEPKRPRSPYDEPLEKSAKKQAIEKILETSSESIPGEYNEQALNDSEEALNENKKSELHTGISDENILNESSEPDLNENDVSGTEAGTSNDMYLNESNEQALQVNTSSRPRNGTSRLHSKRGSASIINISDKVRSQERARYAKICDKFKWLTGFRQLRGSLNQNTKLSKLKRIQYKIKPKSRKVSCLCCSVAVLGAAYKKVILIFDPDYLDLLIMEGKKLAAQTIDSNCGKKNLGLQLDGIVRDAADPNTLQTLLTIENLRCLQGSFNLNGQTLKFEFEDLGSDRFDQLGKFLQDHDEDKMIININARWMAVVQHGGMFYIHNCHAANTDASVDRSNQQPVTVFEARDSFDAAYILLAFGMSDENPNAYFEAHAVYFRD